MVDRIMRGERFREPKNQRAAARLEARVKELVDSGMPEAAARTKAFSELRNNSRVDWRE
jgi:hypothetical protein